MQPMFCIYKLMYLRLQDSKSLKSAILNVTVGQLSHKSLPSIASI